MDNTIKRRKSPSPYRSAELLGRRKTRKVIKREPKRLPKVFRCPRCGEQSVVVDLDRQLNQGRIKCGRCQLSAKLPIHSLTQTIDVYAKFLDLFYEGKIEDTPTESVQKPEPVTQVAPSGEAEQVTIAIDPATSDQVEVIETSQTSDAQTPGSQNKPKPAAEPTQQTD